MNHNRSEIMKEAWHQYRNLSRNLRGEVQGNFATCLRIAWAKAKQQTQQTPEQQLFILEMKDRWDDADYQTARVLREQVAKGREVAA